MEFDYIIVGAGPAGLQMAYFLQQSNRNYVVFEAAEKAATFFARQPRSNKLISINKKFNYFDEEEFNLRHDWNSLLSEDKEMRFTKYSDDLYPKARDLHKYANDYAERFSLNIRYRTRVTRVSKPSDMFSVTTEDGQTHTCKCLLMATGPIEENLPEDIEGIELADTYDKYDLDKTKYQNKIVLVLGGGNSAFETAHHLSDSAAIVHVAFQKKIKFAWNTHFVGDLRAVNNNVIDMYQLKSLHATLGQQLLKIQKNENGKLVASFKDLLTHLETPSWAYFDTEYDHIISCLGWRYVKPEMFDSTVSIDTVKSGRYPALSNCWESSTENLFFIGTTMAAIDRKSASGFIHGFRYNIRTLYHLLENRFFATPLPSIQLPAENLQAIAEWAIKRVSTTDSLYQMYGFLCDVITIDDQGHPIIFKDLPRQHVMERPEFKSAKHSFILYLAYGFGRLGNAVQPVEVTHTPDYFNNHCANFIHPFLEYYSEGEYVDQTELHESFIVRYDQWATDKGFTSWKTATSINYVKFFINDKMKWTDEVFNLLPVTEEEAKKTFVPLTEDELARIPALWEKSECKPPQDLMPTEVEVPAARILRPTKQEVMASVETACCA